MDSGNSLEHFRYMVTYGDKPVTRDQDKMLT